MADDTIDVSKKAQIVIVLRYAMNEEVIGRFGGFFTPENQTTQGIS